MFVNIFHRILRFSLNDPFLLIDRNINGIKNNQQRFEKKWRIQKRLYPPFMIERCSLKCFGYQSINFSQAERDLVYSRNVNSLGHSTIIDLVWQMFH